MASRLAHPFLEPIKFVNDMFDDTVTHEFGPRGRGTFGVLGAFCAVMSGAGLGVAFFGESHQALGFYLMFLGWFHWSEWFSVAIFNPKLCSADSFLLNHSRAYHVAFVASVGEYLLESHLFPGLKSLWFVTLLGVVAAVFGLFMRCWALFHGGAAFTHIIQDSKRDEHQLVTDGPFSIVRHPGYFGWFVWTVTSQVIMVNPLCVVAYAIASYNFFADRIPTEEAKLIQPDFFGDQYVAYQNRVPMLFPFTKPAPAPKPKSD